MKYYYRCIKSGGAYPGSSIEADPANLVELGTGDFSVGGVKALYVYFFGQASNAGSDANALMWVALDDGTNKGYATYPDGMDKTREESWHEWNIDLDIFGSNSVTLSSISKVLLGFGGYPDVTGKVLGPGAQAHGKGDTVYFEDFRLWPPMCFPEKTRGTGNFNDDCLINYFDLEIMGNEWLFSDDEALAGIPATAPVIYYQLDDGSGFIAYNKGSLGGAYDINFPSVDDPNDPAADGNSADPNWVTPGAPSPDVCDPNAALYFSGTEDANRDILLIPPMNLNSNTVSITAWIKRDGWQAGTFTGLVHHRASGTDAGCAGLSYGYSGKGFGYTSQNWEVGYVWSDNDSKTWTYHSGLICPDNQWTFVALTIAPDQANIYMSDGATMDIATHAYAQQPQPFSSKTRIASDSGSSRGFKGIMDEIRIYDVTLGAGDVLGLAGVAGKVYIPLNVPSNIYPKSPPGAPYDPNNIDAINAKDYAIIADNWLDSVKWPTW
jgi:hypothetical protein